MESDFENFYTPGALCSELGGLHMQPLTKLDTIGVEYIGAKCAKGRVVFL